MLPYVLRGLRSRFTSFSVSVAGSLFLDMQVIERLVERLLDASQPTDRFTSHANALLRRTLRLPHLRYKEDEFPPEALALCAFTHVSELSLETVHQEYSSLQSQKGFASLPNVSPQKLYSVWEHGWKPAAAQIGAVKREEGDRGIFDKHYIFFVPNLLFSQRSASKLLTRLKEHGGDGQVVSNGEKGIKQVEEQLSRSPSSSKTTFLCGDLSILKKCPDTVKISLRPSRWLTESLRDKRIKLADMYEGSTPSKSQFAPKIPSSSTAKRRFSEFRAEVYFSESLSTNKKVRQTDEGDEVGGIQEGIDEVAKQLFPSPTRIQGFPRERDTTPITAASKQRRVMNWACELRTSHNHCEYPMNAKVCELLGVVQESYAAKKDAFRAVGYQKAIAKIRTLQHELETVEDVRQLGKQNAIGARMELKIVEIIRTGRLQQAEAVLANVENVAVKTLCDVWGVGPVKAMTLVAQGIRSIENLRSAVKSNPQLLDRNQKIGLRLYEDFLHRIPRNEVADLEMYVRRIVKSVDKTLDITVAGSYLRGKATCGDVDIMIYGAAERVQRAFPKVKETMKKNRVLTDDLLDGPGKYFGVFKFPGRKHGRIDLFAVPEEEYPYALLTYTGSAIFNR